MTNFDCGLISFVNVTIFLMRVLLPINLFVKAAVKAA